MLTNDEKIEVLEIEKVKWSEAILLYVEDKYPKDSKKCRICEIVKPHSEEPNTYKDCLVCELYGTRSRCSYYSQIATIPAKVKEMGKMEHMIIMKSNLESVEYMLEYHINSIEEEEEKKRIKEKKLRESIEKATEKRRAKLKEK